MEQVNLQIFQLDFRQNHIYYAENANDWNEENLSALFIILRATLMASPNGAKNKTNSKSRFQLHAIKEAPQVMMRIIFSVFN